MKVTIITLSVPWDDEGDDVLGPEEHPSEWDWTAITDAPDHVRVLSWDDNEEGDEGRS
jgi:hypothetical protein